MSSIRDSLLAELRRVCGPDDVVHIIPWQDNADTLDRRTIMLKQTTIEKASEAPRAAIRVSYVLTFISPNLDPSLAEAELDTWVPETLDDLRMNWFSWSRATKAIFQGSTLCYDVDAYVLTKPANTPREDTPQ